MILRSLIILFFVFCTNAYPFSKDNIVQENFQNDIQLYVMLSAKTQSLEIIVRNARLHDSDEILITNNEPKGFLKSKRELKLLNNTNIKNFLEWKINNGIILGKYKPKQENDVIQTNLKFNYIESQNISITTKCYSHWASYVDENGNILAMNCIHAFPTWMNDMKDDIAKFNMKQIFIPGSHDSGSYRPNFNPEKDENIVTKYSLTQDDNIYGQLMHGIRYLDIRMGYYALTNDKFFIVHGITKQRPLKEALEQLKDFVIKTNEIVIFDIRQFETGFQNIQTHYDLVEYIKSYVGEYIVDASLGWDITLEKIWQSKKNIILTYGNGDIRKAFPSLFFNTVNHRWGNKDDWPSLEKYLKSLHGHFNGNANSDMAELTPNAWGIITDKYGGLRNLADEVNLKVSKLYFHELGLTTNILSVDFYRGTLVTDLAIYFNKLRKNQLVKKK